MGLKIVMSCLHPNHLTFRSMRRHAIKYRRRCCPIRFRRPTDLSWPFVVHLLLVRCPFFHPSCGVHFRHVLKSHLSIEQQHHPNWPIHQLRSPGVTDSHLALANLHSNRNRAENGDAQTAMNHAFCYWFDWNESHHFRSLSQLRLRRKWHRCRVTVVRLSIILRDDHYLLSPSSRGQPAQSL